MQSRKDKNKKLLGRLAIANSINIILYQDNSHTESTESEVCMASYASFGW